ncbi:MAG TPA: polysaccharide biosynthesis tyrosine autokinase [Alphaproteobacteria bacterium]|nr:polysaccharide biosynthesis tyrosine autokinase [Alphaproteobacteria bacterium]
MTTVTRLPLPNNDGAHAAAPLIANSAESQFDVRRILGILKRRKLMILGVMFVITSMATLIVNQATPLYRAEARIIIQKSQQNFIPLQAVAQGMITDMMTADTQAAVIGSRELAAKAVDRLSLVDNPLFNPTLLPPKPGLFASLLDPVRDLISVNIARPLRAALFGKSAETAAAEANGTPDANADVSPADKRRELVQGVIDTFLGGLTVVTSQTSHVVAIQYVSTDPRMAAVAANTVAELYILDQLTKKGETTSRAAEWLNQRVNEMRQRMVDSEQRLDAYRKQSGIVDLGGANTTQQQIARLDEELVLARTKLSEAEARNAQVQEQLKNGNIDTAAAVLNNKLIQSLRDQETTLLRKLSEFKTQFKDTHPQVRLTEQQLDALRAKIATEVQKIAAEMDNELQITRIRTKNLQTAVDDLQKKLEKQNEAEVTIRSLQSEVNANKQLYETLLSRFKETDLQQDSSLQQADARIISRAMVPGAPYYPRKNLMVMAALIVSAIVGMALAVVTELFDQGFRSLGQIESATGLPTLAMIPALKEGEAEGKRPHEIAIERPNSSFGEAIRTLRTGLLLTRIDHPPRTIMLTSSVPGEGKTSLALSLACSAARSAQKAIVLDCDFRHPNMHNYLEYPNKLGLTDFLAGQASLEDVVEIDPRSGVHFITAGSRAPNPIDLLGSQEMKKLLARLSSLYDIVVIDAPPVLPVSDALVLVRIVDKTMYLVRWEKTKRETALNGLKMLVEAGADIAGVCLTQVDLKKHAQYYYSDSGYYYASGYKNYYVE